jgi:hypothetical protein
VTEIKIVRLSISRKNLECPEFGEELTLLCLKLELTAKGKSIPLSAAYGT